MSVSQLVVPAITDHLEVPVQAALPEALVYSGRLLVNQKCSDLQEDLRALVLQDQVAQAESVIRELMVFD